MLHLMSEVQPFIISHVLMLMYERAAGQGKVPSASHFFQRHAPLQELEALFRSLAYTEWVPTQADVTVIRSWLMKPLGTTANVLARIVLDGMNWGLTAVPAHDSGQGCCPPVSSTP